MHKIWFSIYDFSFDYKGNENAFIEAENFNWAKELSFNTEKIVHELRKYIKSNNLPSYFNTSMVSKKNSWKTISLKTWGIEHFKNQKEFPLTTSIISKYSQIVSVSFSLLEPASNILPHCGDTNAIYRCHLGLDIPGKLPDCGFKVKNEERSWENGKWLFFMDAYNHEAWNYTNKERYILIVDVLRDEFLNEKPYVCSTVLTSLYLQRRAERYNFLLFKRPVTVKIIAKVLRPVAQIGIFMVNKLKFY